MIHGLNFNSTPIPDGFKKKFAASKRFNFTMARQVTTKFLDGKAIDVLQDIPTARWNAIAPKGKALVTARLQGVCTSPEEALMMIIQADNTHRLLFIATRKAASGFFYGIYVY